MHKDVYEYLVESGISCEYMEKEKQIKIFIQTEGNQYELRMKFPQYYPYEFPEIYIEDQKELCIPHLYTDNKLCLYDTINYIGEWHTHPNMQAVPSSTDISSLKEITEKVKGVLPGTILIIAGKENQTNLILQKDNAIWIQSLLKEKEEGE